jgi:outer membrane protein assembly factor BamB
MNRSLKPLWRVELGPSYSGPIVSGELVFTTETVAKQKEIVRALDRQTGREIWKHEWEGAISVPFFAKSNGDWIRSTPACDGDNLFIAGMRDVLVCLAAKTGEDRWRFDFPAKLKTALPDFGFVCSPLVDGETVYVQAGASLARLDKRTGALLWRTLQDKGGMWGGVFSSPVIAELAGQRQMVVQTRDRLAGVSLADGKVLWSQPVEAFRGMIILTPVVFGDGVFTSTYGGKTIFYKVEKQNGAFAVLPAWTHKAQGYMSTPVVVDGVAYEHLRSQRVTAIDLKTGQELWTTEQAFGKYWSLVAQGDRILALDERGCLYLFKADRAKFALLGERKLSLAETWAHLAVSGDMLLVREINALRAYVWRADGN